MSNRRLPRTREHLEMLALYSEFSRDSLNVRRKMKGVPIGEWYEGRASAFGFVAASLAEDMGLATCIVNKPKVTT